MSDEIKSNLEPIDETDLNLKEKFSGGAEKPMEQNADKRDNKQEKVFVPEQKAERKEGQMEKEAVYGKILSKVSTASPVVYDDIAEDAKKAGLEQDAEGKINNLVNLAQLKGIPHAVKVAMHMEDNYILDEFHDRLLADELHDALVKKGMIHPV